MFVLSTIQQNHIVCRWIPDIAFPLNLFCASSQGYQQSWDVVVSCRWNSTKFHTCCPWILICHMGISLRLLCLSSQGHPKLWFAVVYCNSELNEQIYNYWVNSICSTVILFIFLCEQQWLPNSMVCNCFSYSGFQWKPIHFRWVPVVILVFHWFLFE